MAERESQPLYGHDGGSRIGGRHPRPGPSNRRGDEEPVVRHRVRDEDRGSAAHGGSRGSHRFEEGREYVIHGEGGGPQSRQDLKRPHSGHRRIPTRWVPLVSHEQMCLLFVGFIQIGTRA
jgi:hypothetical protein